MPRGEFRTAIDEVLAARRPAAMMCSEAVWWRCHRRMIADFLVLAGGAPVRHLMHDGRDQDHRPTDVARLTSAGLLIYDGGKDPNRRPHRRRAGPPAASVMRSARRQRRDVVRLARHPPHAAS
ncbi:MAG: DUF488 family protein [Pseudonocardiaceae bacterium]